MTNSNLHKLVYCSRNLISGTRAEVATELQSILASARTNNLRLGVTGALLYNNGNFAQALEGSLPSIAYVFEQIQRDPRHSEVTVLHSGPCDSRDFPAWSMAFAGSSSEEGLPEASAAFDAVHSSLEGAAEQMLSVLKDLVIREDDWVLLDAA